MNLFEYAIYGDVSKPVLDNNNNNTKKSSSKTFQSNP
jgi:hypothetical protein